MGTNKTKEYIMEVADNGMVTKVGQELVRCKDCHYGIRSSKEDIFCVKAIYTDKYKRPDWFCADGERSVK